jgi:hypothetical protein
MLGLKLSIVQSQFLFASIALSGLSPRNDIQRTRYQA